MINKTVDLGIFIVSEIERPSTENGESLESEHENERGTGSEMTGEAFGKVFLGILGATRSLEFSLKSYRNASKMFRVEL